MAKNHKKKKQKNTTQKKNSNDLQKITQIKKFILAIITLAIIVLYFSMPLYKNWLKHRIFIYIKEIPHQIATMDVEQRILERHGYNYLIPKFIHNEAPDSAIVLLPPKTYVQKNFSKDFYRWHHVVWNYYFFGNRNYLNYTHPKVHELSKITHAIVCDKSKLQIREIKSSDDLNSILAAYENKIYSPKLAAK